MVIPTKPFGCEYNPYSNYIVLGIPLDNSASYRPGTRFAPTSIREASCNIEFYSLYSNIDVDNILYNDLGDLAVIPGDNKASLERIKHVIEEIATEYHNNTFFIIGGEHVITYGVLAGLKKIYKDVGYIVFDAHLDMRKEYLGYMYSHASTNRLVIDEIGIKPLIIAARAFSSEEINYVREMGVEYIKPRELKEKNSLTKILDYVSTLKYTYISIDMDALDPAYAPGVSNPEPLGISPFELLDTLKYIIDNSQDIVGIDVAEVNPCFDQSNITSILAAKIIVETTGMIKSKEQ